MLTYRPAGVAKIDPGTKERSRVNPASLAANGNCFETASIWIDLNFIRNIWIWKLLSQKPRQRVSSSFLNSEQRFNNLHVAEASNNLNLKNMKKWTRFGNGVWHYEKSQSFVNLCRTDLSNTELVAMLRTCFLTIWSKSCKANPSVAGTVLKEFKAALKPHDESLTRFDHDWEIHIYIYTYIYCIWFRNNSVNVDCWWFLFQILRQARQKAHLTNRWSCYVKAEWHNLQEKRGIETKAAPILFHYRK